MNRITALLFLMAAPAFSMVRANGDCMQGGHAITSNGITSTQRVMQSFVTPSGVGQTPTAGCTVTVYVTGTSTVASIYSDNSGTPLANPFTADATGHWFFYGSGRFDVTMSGSGIASPFTIGDVKLLDIPSVTDYGAVCNGSHDDSAALVAAFAGSVGIGLTFPSGLCVYNNGSAALTINNYSGSITGPSGSGIKCYSLSNTCVEFSSATNLTISGLSFTYSPTPTVRGTVQFNLYILSGTNVFLNQVSAYNGPTAGVTIQQSTNVQITDMYTHDLFANGLFFTNSTQVTVKGLVCVAAQDYCMEASGYDPFAGVPSGACQYVNVSGLVSVNTFSGALFNSCPDSSLSNFSIYNTYGPAIGVIQDPSTTTTKWPYRTQISNGSISNVGYLMMPSNLADAIHLQMSNAPDIPVDVEVSNVSIYNVTEDGVRVGTGSADQSLFNLKLSNVSVDTTAQEGFRFHSGSSISFSNISSKKATGRAFETTDTGGLTFNVTGSGLYILDCNTANSDDRAIYTSNPGTTQIDGVTLVDDRNPAQCYVMGDGTVGTVKVTGITPVLPHGSLTASSATGTYLLTGQANLLGSDPIANNSTTAIVFVGTGSPNGSVMASPPALYLNLSGGSGTTLYVKESGSNTNTGWVGK